MKLGIGVDIWNQARLDTSLAQEQLARVQMAERLGYDSVWSAEIYGIDAITPLAWIAAHTRHIRLGTAVCQVAARPAVTTAMQFGTLEALAGPGRAICGLGLVGPPDRGGVVRPALGQAQRPAARLRVHHQEGVRPTRAGGP